MARRRKKRGGFRKAARAAYRAAGRGYRRARARKRSSFRMGLIGKSGIGLAGGVPVALAAIDALDVWTNPFYAPASIGGKLRLSLAAFTNNLTSGFGLGTALPTSFTEGTNVFGVPNSMAAASGGYLKTTAAGLTLVVIDGVVGAIYRVLSKGKARAKIMGKQLISG